MTRQEYLDYLDEYDLDEEELSIEEAEREIAIARVERRAMFIEELEESQSASGFYAFQDRMETWRSER